MIQSKQPCFLGGRKQQVRYGRYKVTYEEKFCHSNLVGRKSGLYKPRCDKTVFFLHYEKTKTQISCVVTAQLISAFVFATQMVQSLYFLNTKVKASSHLLLLYSPVCVGPGRKP